MAQTNDTLTAIAVKRLSGKAHTSEQKTLFQEKEGSTVQTAASTVFAESLPNNPSSTLFLVQSESLGTPGTTMKVEFELYPFGDTYLSSDPNAPASNANTYHAYGLILSTSFDDGISDGDFDSLTSTPTAKGSFPFVGGSYLSGSRGRLQIIPEFISNIPAGQGGNNPYSPTITSTNGTTIGGTNSVDWYLDAYSGILFIENPVAYGSPGNPNNGAAVPSKVEAFMYTGKYQDQVTFTANDVGLHISASEGGGFSLANDATASFESGSAGITVTATPATNKITIGASTDNVQFANLTGSNLLITNTASITYFETTYESSSIIFSSGSTKFGDTMDDTHVFTGSLFVTGNLTLEDGTIEANRFIASASTAEDAGFVFRPSDNDLTANSIKISSVENMQFKAGGVFQFNQNTQLLRGKKLQLNDADNTSRFSISNVSTNTGSNQNNTRLGIENMGGTEIVSISGSGFVGIGTTTPDEKLTVEGNISASGFVSGSDLYVTSTLTALDGGVTISSNASPELFVGGNITASGDISASGLLFASASDDSGTLGSIAVAMYDTASGRLYYTGSSALGGDTTLLEASASAGIFLSASEGTGFSIGLMQSSSFTSGSGTGLTITADNATNNIEFELVGVLSSSQQIATDISGAIDAATASLSASIIGTTYEVEVTDGGTEGNIVIGLPDAVRISSSLLVGINSSDPDVATITTTHTGDFNLINANATTINFGGDATTINMGAAGASNVSIKGSASIDGDLIVKGTTTSINTDQLLVEDPFILLASSSSDPNTDGGIIIQTDASANGTALFYDRSSNRWALAQSSSVAHDVGASSAVAQQFVVSVSSSALNPTGTPSNFGNSSTAQLGMMYVATTDNDGDTNTIWIYG